MCVVGVRVCVSVSIVTAGKVRGVNSIMKDTREQFLSRYMRVKTLRVREGGGGTSAAHASRAASLVKHDCLML